MNAHGTSTELNDRLEALALHQVFGDAVPPVTANKGAIGHLVGAAGAVGGDRRHPLDRDRPGPAHRQLRDPRPGDRPRRRRRRAPRGRGRGRSVSNSFAFGGHNVTLVFEP